MKRLKSVDELVKDSKIKYCQIDISKKLMVTLSNNGNILSEIGFEFTKENTVKGKTIYGGFKVTWG